MNEYALWVAVYNRLTSDTGTGGLFNTGSPLVTNAYNTQAAPGATFPYIVFSVASATPDDTFERNVIRYQVRFTCWSSADVGLQVSSQIMDRVYARFHRYTLTLSGTWTASAMRMMDGAGRTVDDNAYGVIHDYEVYLTQTS